MGGRNRKKHSELRNRIHHDKRVRIQKLVLSVCRTIVSAWGGYASMERTSSYTGGDRQDGEQGDVASPPESKLSSPRDHRGL